MPKIKSRKERLIEAAYNEVLNDVENVMGNKITFTNDLEKMAKYVLGHKFKGVFSSDNVAKLSVVQPYAIINLDKQSEPGSHWIAAAYIDPKDDTIMIYDSFGRDSKKIIPNLYSFYHGVIDTDNDAEQRIKEDNCGQRCLAWLIIFDQYGKDLAKLV